MGLVYILSNRTIYFISNLRVDPMVISEDHFPIRFSGRLRGAGLKKLTAIGFRSEEIAASN